MKCDPRAYAQCPSREFCGSSAGTCDFAQGSDCDRFNQEVLSRPPTYGDGLRVMSDEGLAHVLMAITVDGKRPWCNFHCRYDGKYGCQKCIMKWLKQPVEVQK